jgi:hypothetical protein
MPSREVKPEVGIPSTGAGSTPASTEAVGGAASGSESSEKGSDDEAMKRLLESMQKEAPKKP